jgi:hypothetical protein
MSNRNEEIEFSDDENLINLADSTNSDPRYLIDKKGLEIVEFAQRYATKHSADLPGKTHRERRAWVVEQIKLGQLKMNEILL